MAVVSMKQLLDSGVHFGHQTRRWNPKMKRFIFTERNGIYIIDLQQTLGYIDNAYEFVKQTVAHGGSILFVGTKRQAQEVVAEQATRVGMPYVNQRWLGGMLTNFQTVFKRLERLKELEDLEQTGALVSLSKKEQLVLSREKAKLERSLGGIRDMKKVPSAIWIVDTKKEHIAVGEARKLNIPVVAILDTNCDPDEVDYKIPGNDDAIRSIAVLTRVIADAVADGLMARSAAQANAGREEAGEPAIGGDEPLADWERELLTGGAEQAAPAESRVPDEAAGQAADPGAAELARLGLLVGGGRAGAGHEALGDGVGDDAGQQRDGADRVVVAGDLVVDLVGVAVGVQDRDDRDVKLAGLTNRDVLLLGVDDPDSAGNALHVTDTTEGLLELGVLALEDQELLLGETGTGHIREVDLAELLHPLKALVDGLEVGQHAAEPALVHVGHAHAGGLLGNGLLGLLLRTDEEDAAAVGNRLLDELEGAVDVVQRLQEVNDVDAVALREDEALHLRVPTTGLVTEVDAALKQLPHRDDGHGRAPRCSAQRAWSVRTRGAGCSRLFRGGRVDRHA
jgi:small subunit ribosomal protein S2